MSVTDDEYREKVQGRKCTKAGCDLDASMLVKYRDPGGALEWPSCRSHAEAFEAWLFEESYRLSATTVSEFYSSDGESVVIKVIGP